MGGWWFDFQPRQTKDVELEVLVLCLAHSTQKLETDWPAQSQDDGLGWDITAYPRRGVSVGWHYKGWPQVRLA